VLAAKAETLELELNALSEASDETNELLQLLEAGEMPETPSPETPSPETPAPTEADPCANSQDNDGDGYYQDGCNGKDPDCDDNDWKVYPGNGCEGW